MNLKTMNKSKRKLNCSRVILEFQVVEIHSHFIPQIHQLVITILLCGSVEIAAVGDCIVDRMEIVKDEELLDIRHQFQETFTGTNDIRCSNLHFISVLLTLCELR